jgi:hypothetical protein
VNNGLSHNIQDDQYEWKKYEGLRDSFVLNYENEKIKLEYVDGKKEKREMEITGFDEAIYDEDLDGQAKKTSKSNVL